MYGAVAKSRPESSPVSTGTFTPRPPALSAPGASARVAARRPVAATNPVAMTMAHSEGSRDRKSTRLNSSHLGISYAVFCLKKKNIHRDRKSIVPQHLAGHIRSEQPHLQ